MLAIIESGSYAAPAARATIPQDLLSSFNARRLALWGVCLDELSIMAARFPGSIDERTNFMWRSAIEILYGRTV
jgi:hypothetical protein